MNKDDSIEVMRYCSLQKQIDEMYEYTQDYGRVQFVKMLVEQRNEIAELKKEKEKLNKWFDEQNPNSNELKDDFVVVRLSDIKDKLKELEKESD